MTDDALIFVYGTLRPGGSAEARMIGQGHWLGPATASGRLYRISHYPGFVADTAGDVIKGALFEAADPDALLAALDIYEGCGPDDQPPHEYERIRITVVHQGRSRTAWTYVYGWPVSEVHRISSGDFLGDSA
jgi:gamma-glutamylcyclotransferase (GGCT)/AIG2-like uncharacterized protein YtfP